MMKSTIQDKKLIAKLNELKKRARDAKPAFKKIAARMLAATHKNFHKQQAPDGTPWSPWSPATERRRGTGNKRAILMDSGDLRQRCDASHGATYARVANQLSYARVHQRGSKKKHIPARPFLGLTKQGNKQYKKILTEYLTDV